ncbi:hypothetical protein L1049_013001 [Liquidambar formosana]|uniref:Uncharacterized protein n=1 Tax=Liquidambar formosana TaxID=63359 RepID=A0AAP0WTW6_LIQFO
MLRHIDFALHPILFHLGGEEFCFLWSEDQSQTLDKLFFRSHCIKLRISKRVDSKGQGSLIAVINSCQSYLIDHHVSFTNGLLLNGRLGAEHYMEECGASRAGQVFLVRKMIGE